MTSPPRLPLEIWQDIIKELHRDIPKPNEYASWSELHQHDLTVIMRVNSVSPVHEILVYKIERLTIVGLQEDCRATFVRFSHGQ